VTLALDTNVFVDLIRGRQPRVRQRHAAAILAGEAMVTSLVVFHELQFGIAVSRDPVNEALNVDEAFLGVEIVPLTLEDMQMAAQVRATLRRQGAPIGPYDALIAGQALARGWTLVTSNTGEFARVPGLDIQDWSQS